MRWIPLILAALPAIYPTAVKASPGYHCSAGVQQSWQYDEFPEGEVHEIRLRGTDDIRLNGARISRAALLRHLERAGVASPPPFTILGYDGETDCGLVQEFRVAMTRALPCHLRGRCGEHLRSARPPSREEMERAIAQATADVQAAADEMRRTANDDPDPPEPD